MRNTSIQRTPQAVAPLLQAIDREVSERSAAILRIDAKLVAFAGTRAAHREEIARLESSRSTHRRELYRIEQELGRLGIPFDAENPQPLTVEAATPGSGGPRLDDTRFHLAQFQG